MSTQVKIVRSKYVGSMGLVIVMGKRWFDPFAPIAPVLRLARKALARVRMLLPSFWSVGFRDCDSGGRVHRWCLAYALNEWDLRRKWEAWDASSDGPAVVHQVSPIRFALMVWESKQARENRI